MLGQARIVLYPWAGDAAAILLESSAPPMPSMWNGQPAGGRYVVAPRGASAALVGWRMIGGNNRELGRGARPIGSVAEAYRAIHDAKLAFSRPEVRMMLDPVAGWSWHISLDGERVAVSSRGYQRQRECEYGVEKFREHFPTAQLVVPTAPKPRVPRHPSLTMSIFLGAEGSSIVLAVPTNEVTT